MHRLLVSSETLTASAPAIPADAARHLRVLRPKPGEEIELFDGRGVFRVYVWNGEALTAAQPAETAVRDANNSLTLFACVTKGSRWDWTIEKATELGVARIVPVISARTIVRIPKEERAAKRLRWQRIAEDAARQSDAKFLPEILEAVDFNDALPMVRETRCFVGALVTPPACPLVEAVGVSPSGALAVFVGPEGDFSPEELGALLEIATPTSFGPTVLRAETAAIFAVSVVSALRHRRGSDAP